jgi:hypothetical protein
MTVNVSQHEARLTTGEATEKAATHADALS